MKEIGNSSVEILGYPVRNGKIHRNFDFILPKFHLTLPKFYSFPPWGFSISSVKDEISPDKSEDVKRGKVTYECGERLAGRTVTSDQLSKGRHLQQEDRSRPDGGALSV